MKSFIKKVALIFILCFATTLSFAENWFVCLGSFQVKENADVFCAELKKNKIPAFSFCQKADNKYYFRVFYAKQFGDADSARDYKSKFEKSSSAKNMNLSKLWICKAPVELKFVQTNKKETVTSLENKSAENAKPELILAEEKNEKAETDVKSEINEKAETEERNPAVEEKNSVVEEINPAGDEKSSEVVENSEKEEKVSEFADKTESEEKAEAEEKPLETVENTESDEVKTPDAEKEVKNPVAEENTDAPVKSDEEKKSETETNSSAEEKTIADEGKSVTDEGKNPAAEEKSVTAEKAETEEKKSAGEEKAAPLEEFDFDEEVNILEINNPGNMILSSSSPYSVLVRKFRNEDEAKEFCEALKKDGVSSFMANTLSQAEGIEFLILSGAFENDLLAEDFMDELKSQNIKTIGIVDYNELSDLIYEYDQMIETEGAVEKIGKATFPYYFNENMKAVVKFVPYFKECELERTVVCDLNELKKSEKTILEVNEIAADVQDLSKVKAVSNSIFKDEVHGNLVKIFVLSGDSGAFGPLQSDDKIESNINGDLFTINMVNKTGDLEIIVKAESVKDTNSLLNRIKSDSGLLNYKSFRKSFVSLPYKKDDVERNFVSLTYAPVDENYIFQRSFDSCAKHLEGEKYISAEFVQNGFELDVSAIDLVYNYNSNLAYGKYVEEKNELPSNDYNHSVELENTSGWYINNSASGQSIAFEKNSFIVTVMSSQLMEEEMIQVCDSLGFWIE